MAQERQRFDEICVGVPVANGYPAPASTRPPPSPTNTETSSGSELSKKQKWACNLCVALLAIIIATVIIICLWRSGYFGDMSPSFKVESVSVLLDKSNNSSDNATRAEWNLRLSVKAGKDYHKFDYNDLDVLFRCMSPNWSRTLLVQSSNGQDPKNMTSLSATIDTLLPRSFQAGSVLGFDVMFLIRKFRTRIEVVCNNLTVEFSPDATKGMMEGAPRLCDNYHYDQFR